MIDFFLRIDYIKKMNNMAIAMVCFLIVVSLLNEDWVTAGVFAGGIFGFAFCLLEPRTIAMIWIIGSPTIFVFPNNFLDALPFVTAERIIFVVLVGLLILKRGFGHLSKIPYNLLEKTILIYLIWMFINFAMTFPETTKKELRPNLAFYVQGILMPLASYFIARRLRWDEKAVRHFLLMLVGAGIFLVMVGAMQFFLNITWFIPKYMEVIHLDRTTGTFANAVEYGNVLVAFLVLAILMYVRATDQMLKMLSLMSVGIIFSGIIMCMTRSPIVAFASGALLIAWHDTRVRPLFATGSILALLVGSIAVPIVFDIEHLIWRFTDLEPIYGRIGLWTTALNMAIHNPLFGLEFGRYTFSLAKPDYLVSFGPVAEYFAWEVGIPHMEYLHILVLSGFPGLFLFLLVLYRFWSLLSGIRKRHGLDTLCGQLALYASALLITYLVNGCFVDSAFNSFFPLFIFFMAGVVTSLDEHETSKRVPVEPVAPASIKIPGEELPVRV